MLMALGRHFHALWFSDDCAMALKKKIIRILIREIMVSLDDDTQDLTFMIHWQGGCHTTLSMKKPLSGAIKYKTPEQQFPLSLQAHCSAGELPWPFVNFDATILPTGTILGYPLKAGHRYTTMVSGL